MYHVTLNKSADFFQIQSKGGILPTTTQFYKAAQPSGILHLK